MSKNIVIVDYSMGNLGSIQNMLKKIGYSSTITSDIKKIELADKLILPGVGHFDRGMEQLHSLGIIDVLNQKVLQAKTPVLGICLGMQLLGISSTEDGNNNGLGYVNGHVVKFDNNLVKVPHVGFNQVKVNNEFKLFHDFNNEPTDFYFTHSYRMICDVNINQCYCNYQNDFVASFEQNNIAGAQFHPELSQTNGLKLFKNFIGKF